MARVFALPRGYGVPREHLVRAAPKHALVGRGVRCRGEAPRGLETVHHHLVGVRCKV